MEFLNSGGRGTVLSGVLWLLVRTLSCLCVWMIFIGNFESVNTTSQREVFPLVAVFELVCFPIKTRFEHGVTNSKQPPTHPRVGGGPGAPRPPLRSL